MTSNQVFRIYPSFLINHSFQDWKPRIYTYKEFDKFEISTVVIPKTNHQLVKESYGASDYFSDNGKTYFSASLSHNTTNCYEFVNGKVKLKFILPKELQLVCVNGDDWIFTTWGGRNIQLWKNGEFVKSLEFIEIKFSCNSPGKNALSVMTFDHILYAVGSQEQNFNKFEITKIDLPTSKDKFSYIITKEELILGVGKVINIYDLGARGGGEAVNFKLVRSFSLFNQSPYNTITFITLITQNLILIHLIEYGELYQRIGKEWKFLQIFRLEALNKFTEHVEVIPRDRKSLVTAAKSLPVDLPLDLLLEVVEFVIDT
jgi:hypothetical protein